ncbi:MAG: histidine kinase [Naasia sp.]|jgi:signal transduction histidine kinase|uniref:ATP-binding protein n=1 Tax=Naasia sp. TaxID=2546198 RepID=UPI00260190AD|nr:ATP-binding protein [Naasia sp.]MCU1569565.1 histidine kinase [Naasia sp.]
MERIVKERDRLLQRSARLLGMSGAAVALLCLAVPGSVAPATLVLLVPLFAVLGLLLDRVGRSRSLVWAPAVVAAGSLILLVLQLANTGALEPLTGVPASPTGYSSAAELAIRILAAWAIASVAVVLTISLGRMIVLGITFTVTLVFTLIALAGSATLPMTLLVLVAGWAIATVIGSLLNAGVVRAARRISNIGRAHRAERQASETEAQRRQGARLLHDTVLATLTLLAHSGVGVAPSAMAQQAGDDARLLRQLRLGSTPTPSSSGDYALQPTSESVLGNTLENVKQRFGRMGLTVSWHGTGQVLLPSDVLDAFLGSLAECLENVRRHAGVHEAHVTITDDDTTIRAMVTDSGVGFDIAAIEEGRLGFKESVLARLREVGGNARVFSAPGSGTTVVLEVPR